jgi:hypothetical protein
MIDESPPPIKAAVPWVTGLRIGAIEIHRVTGPEQDDES